MVQGEQREGQQFVNNTLELDDIPQIELPFRDDISNDFKNIIRALVINQQNIIANTTFLFDRIKDLSSLLQNMAEELRKNARDAPSSPDSPPNPPTLAPILE